MADEEIKLSEERKCFGLKEKDVLRFVIPCATSFIGCLLALAVYTSLIGKPPVKGPCPPPPPPCHRMEAPCPPHHPHYARHHRDEFRGDRPEYRGHRAHKRFHRDIDKQIPRNNAEQNAPKKADKK